MIKMVEYRNDLCSNRHWRSPRCDHWSDSVTGVATIVAVAAIVAVIAAIAAAIAAIGP